MITVWTKYGESRLHVNKGNAKRGISPRLKIRPCDLDLWPWKSIGFQTLLRTKYVPSLVKIHWRILILECSQGCYTVKIWPSDIDLWPWKSIGFQTLLLLWNPWTKLNQAWQEWSLGGSLSNCVRQTHPPFKMAAVTKIRNFFNWPLLLYYKSKLAQILTAATLQWVVLHIIRVFLWNFSFSRFIQIMQIRHILIKFWMEGGVVGHNIERGPPKDHPSQICFNWV
jgi:hypothetical protein